MFMSLPGTLLTPQFSAYSVVSSFVNGCQCQAEWVLNSVLGSLAMAVITLLIQQGKHRTWVWFCWIFPVDCEISFMCGLSVFICSPAQSDLTSFFLLKSMSFFSDFAQMVTGQVPSIDLPYTQATCPSIVLSLPFLCPSLPEIHVLC